MLGDRDAALLDGYSQSIPFFAA
jgi:hypothetical protein